MFEAITAAVIVAIIGPVVLFLLNRIFSRPKESVDLIKSMQDVVNQAQDIANKAIEDLHKEKMISAERDKQMDKAYQDVLGELDLVKRATHGPFRATIDFTTNPLKINRATIDVIVDAV